jgi:uncharacterized membrane protein YhaH (DUF805 family)
MSPIQWALRPIQQYAVFGGRAGRSEFWWYSLLNIIIVLTLSVVLGFVCGIVGMTATAIGQVSNIFLGLWLVATIVPGIAVTVRRLHDIGQSGWWILGSFVPLGGFVMLFFYAKRSQAGPNKYGPNPSDRLSSDPRAATRQATTPV